MERILASLVFAISCGLAGIAVTASGQGPSFDCAKVSSDIERLICQSAEDLPWLDRELAQVYRRMLDGTGSKRDRVVHEQREWLRERSTQCPVASKADAAAREKADICLTKMYVRRIAVLERLLHEAMEQTIVPPPMPQVALLQTVSIGELRITKLPSREDAEAFNVMPGQLSQFYWDHTRRKGEPVPKHLTCREWYDLELEQTDTVSIGITSETNAACEMLAALAQVRPAQWNYLPAGVLSDIRKLSMGLAASASDHETEFNLRQEMNFGTFGGAERAGALFIFPGSISLSLANTARMSDEIVYLASPDSNQIGYLYRGWDHGITGVARGDFNHDGYEDLLAIYGAKAFGGTLSFTKAILLTRKQPEDPIHEVQVPESWWR